MPAHVLFLLGKPPKPGTIVAEVAELLTDRGIGHSVVLPHEAGNPSVEEARGGADMPDPGAADLVVHRGLSRRVDPVVRALANRGVPLCNPWAGTAHTRDRTQLHAALVAAGIPTPRGRSVATWAEVLSLAADRPVVVKVADGGRGSGVVAGHAPGVRGEVGSGETAIPHLEHTRLEEAVAESAHQELPGEPPGSGPYLVEDLVEHDGTDRKLYVAGTVVYGLHKPSTLVREHITEGTPFEVPAELRDLALATAAALELHLVGVDVVLGAEGPLVVDANPFPGYRTVDGAAGSVTEHLLTHLPGQ